MKFEVKVYRVDIEVHPSADALEIARIEGFCAIVKKGQFRTGDLVAYIPQDSVVSNSVLQELGLEGKLAGAQKNRVKPLRLRGIFSEGLVYPARAHWSLGDEVAEELGIVKYEQPIPISLSGEVFNAQYTFGFDIENYKKYPHALVDGEEVVFTEKLHGSFVLAMKIDGDTFSEGVDDRFLVGSKGLVSKGLYLKDNEANTSNSYLRVFKKYNLGEKLDLIGQGKIAIVGEVLGVQDLRYDAGTDQTFRAFGIQINDKWVDPEAFVEICQRLAIPHVPVLYRGAFSSIVLKEHTSGKTTISGAQHIREGLVITPIKERYHSELGRVILKSVSEEYLLRKEGTEFT